MDFRIRGLDPAIFAPLFSMTEVDADTADGTQLESVIARFLSRGGVDYLHAHFARRGCFAARIDRA